MLEVFADAGFGALSAIAGDTAAAGDVFRMAGARLSEAVELAPDFENRPIANPDPKINTAKRPPFSATAKPERGGDAIAIGVFAGARCEVWMGFSGSTTERPARIVVAIESEGPSKSSAVDAEAGVDGAPLPSTMACGATGENMRASNAEASDAGGLLRSSREDSAVIAWPPYFIALSPRVPEFSEDAAA